MQRFPAGLSPISHDDELPSGKSPTLESSTESWDPDVWNHRIGRVHFPCGRHDDYAALYMISWLLTSQAWLVRSVGGPEAIDEDISRTLLEHRMCHCFTEDITHNTRDPTTNLHEHSNRELSILSLHSETRDDRLNA